MDATFALEVMDKAPYVTVSMMRPDGTPYGLPLSLARTDEKTFYFHCAMEGDKLDCIAHCPTVFLSAVTKCAPTVGPKDGSFTLQYKSATAVGKAEIVTDREEKIFGLRAICQRFLPHHMDAFDDAIARSLERTAVVRITLTEPPVGKRKQYDKEGEEMTGQSSESRRARSNGRVVTDEDKVNAPTYRMQIRHSQLSATFTSLLPSAAGKALTCLPAALPPTAIPLPVVHVPLATVITKAASLAPKGFRLN